MASNRAPRSLQLCKKCQQPVCGHVGPTGTSCWQPGPQFVTDTSSRLPADLANIREELEASIRAHEDQILNLSAELGSLRLNSTPSSGQQQSSIAHSARIATISPPSRPMSKCTNTSSGLAINTACSIPKMAAKEKATSFSLHSTSAPPQFAPIAAALPPQPPAHSPQVVNILHQLLQQLQSPASSVPVTQPPISFQPSAPASMLDFCQNPALRQQADQLLGAIPVLEAGGAGYSGNQSAKGKSPGNVTFSAPVKVIQLWPHQFVCRLDSSNVAYKDLDLPQFVYGFLECLRHSAFSDQSKMLAHLSHLMDLASRFQWPAVRAYDARVLKAMEQGTATWDSDLYCFQTGILLPSQEISSRLISSAPAGNKRNTRESICRDWNLSSCRQPCPSGCLHQCLVCKVADHKALVCPKHRCSPTCTWNHE